MLGPNFKEQEAIKRERKEVLIKRSLRSLGSKRTKNQSEGSSHPGVNSTDSEAGQRSAQET